VGNKFRREKKISLEVEDDFQGALSSIYKKLIHFEGSNIIEALGQIDIGMNQHNSRKNKEETLASIEEMS
jgi:hypothetical protein